LQQIRVFQNSNAKHETFNQFTPTMTCAERKSGRKCQMEDPRWTDFFLGEAAGINYFNPTILN